VHTLTSSPLGACAVGFGLLDLKLHVTALSQWSAFAGVPSGRNLHQLRFGFECLRHMRVDLGSETLRVGALCGINSQAIETLKQLNETR
jgi:hypothetical protein